MRRSPNIIYVGDTVRVYGRLVEVVGLEPGHITTREVEDGCAGDIRWTRDEWERHGYLRTASPVQGHQSGGGDAAREGDGT